MVSKKAKVVKETGLKVPKLSKVPSEAIRQAIADLQAIEKKKKDYEINMMVFHDPHGALDRCEVCFAGAVIACAGNSKTRSFEPDDFPADVSDRLAGLDHFRSGAIIEGLNFFGIRKIPLVFAEDINTTDYHSDRKQFFKDMNELADSFEKFNL